jgi:hypothetical protein
MAGRLEEARSPTVEGKVAELDEAGRRKLVRQVDQAASPEPSKARSQELDEAVGYR